MTQSSRPDMQQAMCAPAMQTLASLLEAEKLKIRAAAQNRASQAQAGQAKHNAEPEEPEVPHCHLHRKTNKACKFCKSYNEYVERKNQKIDEKKKAAVEKLRVGSSSNPIKILDKQDAIPLPGLAGFPPAMLERIQRNDYYATSICRMELLDLTKLLTSCDTCEVEARDPNTLIFEPSLFLCSVYRLLTLSLTEGQLQSIFNSWCCWVRCAGALFVRLGAHHERYWNLLHRSLLDDEEFTPFRNSRDNEQTTVGKFVEELFANDKYCSMILPRIPTAARKQMSKRLVLYDQFRRRYAANLEVIRRYQEPNAEVEVCGIDGDWMKAEIVGSTSSTSRCETTRVRYPSGHEEDVPLGMVIRPFSYGEQQTWDLDDLTRSRGRSSQELFDEYVQKQKDAALATGKDYCRHSPAHALGMKGVLPGTKRKEAEKDSDSEEETKFARRKGPSLDHQVKLAAIESKYCARVQTSKGVGCNSEFDGPERLRLG